MPDQLTLDIIDRPRDGALRTLRRAGAIGRARVPGMRALFPLNTGRFVPRVVPRPTPRRVGMLTVWEGDADVPARWQEALGDLAQGAREHWHVHGELARAAFTEPWREWQPETEDAAKLDDGEPALILISGDLHARYYPAFLSDAAKAVGQVLHQPGYLGGVGIVGGSPLNTTSCSTWRTYADAKAYAFKPGAHADAMKRDRARGHHRTEWFMRIRPLAERGTLNGSAPFAGLLGAAVAA